MRCSRRDALAMLGAGLWCGATGWPATRQVPTIPFAFSLYGMRSLPLGRALRVCADIGYSGVELVCMTGWPCDPVALTVSDRRTLRRQLVDQALELPALMDNLRLVGTPEIHRENQDRLKRLGEFARDLAGEGPKPILETVLGGKPEEWDQVKQPMADALADWAAVAAAAGVVVAIKGHVMNAAHRPEDVAWLVRTVNSPWLKAAFDFSHFERQGMTIGGALRTLLADTVFIHVKDNRTLPDGKLEFALPGEGPTDYVEYLRQLVRGNYRGAVCVEVSAQVSGKADYNPIIAAEQSYLNLQRAFEAAGLRART